MKAPEKAREARKILRELAPERAGRNSRREIVEDDPEQDGELGNQERKDADDHRRESSQHATDDALWWKISPHIIALHSEETNRFHEVRIK